MTLPGTVRHAAGPSLDRSEYWIKMIEFAASIAMFGCAAY
jgi:hypothetical protein